MKNLLLYSTILLTSVGAVAQLTVKPTAGNSESFVYVKNQILYVQNDVNLTKNKPGDLEASIYLREQGQLIQGGKSAGPEVSTNDGTGFLSVQQNSPVTNAWAYYDWCSPVGNPVSLETTPITYPKGNSPFGLASIYEDTNPPLLREKGTIALKSANVGTKEGFTLTQLTISKRWLYILKDPGTEKEANYIRINASNGAPAGFGFTMKGVNDGLINQLPDDVKSHKQLYEFRGRPNNGDFKIPVKGPSYSGGGGGNPPKPGDALANMTLTGNPYPSALDLTEVYNDDDNKALSAIFYYDEDRDEKTHLYSKKPFGYGVWIPAGSTGNGVYVNATFFIWKADGSNSTYGGTQPVRTDVPRRYAPIGQGFRFVGGGLTENDTIVTIKNSHRVFIPEGAESIFFRPTGSNDDTIGQDDPEGNGMSLSAQAATNADNRTPQLRLYITFDEALTRDMLLLFSNEATDGYDRGWDGLSPGGMKSDVFFPIGDDSNRLPYVIQGTNYSGDKQIPITFKLHKTSKIDIRAVEQIRKPYSRAYLFDKVENTYRELQKAASVTSSFTLPAGTYEDRFYIVFNKPGGKDLPQGEIDNIDAITANVRFFQNNPQQRLEVQNPQGYILKTASMYDMNGKLVIHETNLGNNSNYSFYTGNLSDGVYIVKLMTADDVAIDYKAIVMNK